MDSISDKLFKVQKYVQKYLAFGLGLSVLICLNTGCVSNAYKYGLSQTPCDYPLTPGNEPNVVSFGGSHSRLDRLERVVQSPRRLLRKLAGRPEPDPAAELQRRERSLEIAEQYLTDNGIHDIYIDVRKYEPSEQWQRLKANQEIRPIWKYTGGTLSWLRYTLLPMRPFGTDSFDPFTNTLNLNSADPASTIYESAEAKQFLRHHAIGRGGYAMVQYVPFVPLIHHTKISSDALTYSKFHLDGDVTDQLYPLTYSRLGSTAVAETLSVVTLSPNAPIYTGPLLRGTGAVIGRTIGASVPRQKSADARTGETQTWETQTVSRQQ